ncbi:MULTISPECIES: pitrilysin family protein [unclassified Polynucleobacter]|jgi:zinc protease|uniref:M16 family metallopeptidase n=1 Tax=unclassified Polynucleobacter TaxID=2640945 RepID=UPI001C0DCEBC|nr:MULTISPECIES: pitrilysin family protein [unclassified Polynucleobacter]MBU3562265.1 insulinase family protein [Polynucleobacter sp. Tro8-14-1]MEA9567881.1 pitrilysin family protein [Polynucleobacter sp. AP-Nickl1-40-C4]
MNVFVKSISVCLFTFCLFSNAHAILPIEKLDSYKGAKAYLVQTKALPMVDIEVSIDAGDRYDPAGKSGLADMVAGLMNYGVKSEKGVLTEAQIADEIADLGANIGLSVSGERAILRIRSLSRKDLRDRAVQLAAAMLSAPTYDSKIVEREKQRTITSLLEAETKPEFVLERRFKKSVYGNYPLADSPTVKSVAAVSVNDLVQFHKQFYRGDRMIVSIVGDIDRAQAEEIVKALLKQIPASGQPIAKLPELERSPVEPLAQREIQIPFDSQQAHIAMGMTAVARNNPDYFPLLVGNYVLGGGGFVSRLMAEVREKRGLAYSVFSYFIPGKENGIFQAGLQTKSDQAALALEVMSSTTAQFIADGPTPSELVAAKANLVNGYPLRIDNNRKLLDNVSSIAWNDLPLDTMDVWTKQVEAVTLEQVNAAFKKYLAMDRMKIVVLGAKNK